MEAHRR